LIEECNHNQEEFYSAEEIEPTSYYYENIFAQEDFYAYRAVSKFYYADFKSAIEDF
jgi:hypothetical protein